MEIPRNIAIVFELAKLLNSKNSPATGKREKTWEEINNLVAEFPSYSEFKTFLSNTLPIKESKSDKPTIGWDLSGICELLSFSQKTDKENPAQQKENEKASSFAIRTLLSKGYGIPDEPEINKSFSSNLACSPHLLEWINQFGTTRLHEILYSGTVSHENIKALIDLDRQSALPPKSIKALCYKVANQMEAHRRDRLPQGTDKIEAHKIITHALAYLTSKGYIKADNSNFDLLSEAFYTPEWTRIALGNTTNINIRVGDEHRSVDNLNEKFIETALLNQAAWEKEQEYFKTLAFQNPIQKADEVFAKTKSATIFEALLQHPSIVGKVVNMTNSTSGLFDRSTITSEDIKIAKLITKSNFIITVYQVLRLAEYGADIETITNLLTKVDKQHLDEFTPQKLAWANRPDLISQINFTDANWYKVGLNIGNKEMISFNESVICNDPSWKPIIDGPHGQEVKAGIAIKILQDMVDTPNQAVQWIKTNKKVLAALPIDEAVANTDFLRTIAKKQVYTCLQLAAALNVSAATLNKQPENTPWSHECHIDAAVAATGKIGHIQSFIKLGGIFTNKGIAAAASKDPILDYVLANSSEAISADTLTTYLNSTTKTDSKLTPNYFKLLRRVDTSDLQSIIVPVMEHGHTSKDLLEFAKIIVEKAGPQQVFNAVISGISQTRTRNQGMEMIEYCVLAGANPDQVLLKAKHYDEPPSLISIKDYLGEQGTALVDIHEAKCKAKNTLAANTAPEAEIDIF